MSNLQKLVKQLTDLGQPITDRQLINKIKCSLPPSYDSLLLAWESVSLNDQTLVSFQSRLVKREATIKKRAGQTDLQAEKAFYTHSQNSSSQSKRRPMSTAQKKAKAEKLAILKKHACCHKYNKRGHFHRDPICSENSGSNDGDSPPSRSHCMKERVKQKHSQANVTASSIYDYSSDSDSLLSPSKSEAYCVTTTSSSVDYSIWYANSGATEHMTDQRQWFQTFSPIADGC